VTVISPITSLTLQEDEITKSKEPSICASEKERHSQKQTTQPASVVTERKINEKIESAL
jgi:hypothetical protein